MNISPLVVHLFIGTSFVISIEEGHEKIAVSSILFYRIDIATLINTTESADEGRSGVHLNEYHYESMLKFIDVRPSFANVAIAVQRGNARAVSVLLHHGAPLRAEIMKCVLMKLIGFFKFFFSYVTTGCARNDVFGLASLVNSMTALKDAR
uniref:ANK_REP_REGION domain-containing protein n=1 Tax=Ascaris lumbricoides TaxID=6252 RepID=A0A0M3HXM7_ASCLU